MPSAALMPNTNINPATFPGDVLPKQLCFGQLTLMRESKLRFWASRSVVATKVAKSSGPSLANVWREVQGSNYWEDLVEPLDPLLRHEIIRYGEFVTACYKAFDLNPSSKRYLNCKYGKNKMLGEVGLGDSGYQITKYIYATPDITSTIPIPKDVHRFDCGRWIGYVAVSSEDQVRKLGRRDILVTFRGTVTNTEWIANLMSWLIPARLDPHNTRPDVKVEAGFLSLYTSDESSSKFGVGSCRQQLLSEVSKLLKKYKGEEISITLAGHSMGSSLALLLAYDIAELGINIISSTQDHDQQSNRSADHVVPVTVFSFAGPRVGNSGFKQRCQELGVKVLRIVNVNDPITKLPGIFFNDNFRVLGYEFPWSYSCYAHVGVELALGFFKMQNPSSVHDLETYISLLRLPKGLQIQRDQGIGFLINGVKYSLLSAQYINAFPWKNAACTLINMIQSHPACFFLD